MVKRKRETNDIGAKTASPLSVFAAYQDAVDQSLASLFASSSGPVRADTKSRLRPSNKPAADGELHLNNTSGVESSGGAANDNLITSEASTVSQGPEFDAQIAEGARTTKRKRARYADDLESSYMNRLARDEAREEKLKFVRGRDTGIGIDPVEDDQGASSADEEIVGQGVDEEDEVPVHESSASVDASGTVERAGRTVFLGNVSTSAIKSKSAKKGLLKHLSSFLKDIPAEVGPHQIESLRFRSTAFASGVGPKRAAYAKKELMDETTQSTNAYAVFSTEIAARSAALTLNGTMVLDRHIRVDYVASPGVIDHRRCVFVGNLSFVDQEATEFGGEGENSQRRPKAKHTADAEEGLWRIFSKAGKVQSVRVVRDKNTRVGKGFGYVQFMDENSVEAALLYNDKKYPPMLPRKLRVMRAKRMKKTGVGKSAEGRSSRINVPSITNLASTGRNKAVSRQGKNKTSTPGTKTASFRKPKSLVFEGHRASKSADGRGKNLKASKKVGERPKNRSSRRGAAFKAAGGKRKRAS